MTCFPYSFLLLITWKAYSTQILITVRVLLLLITWKAYSTQILITVKVLLFTDTNFRGFYQMYLSLSTWICGFKYYMQQLMGKLYMYFVRFLFSLFKWTTKSTIIRTPWLIMISQYFNIHSVLFWQYCNYRQRWILYVKSQLL
jgi:hypothetical protein